MKLLDFVRCEVYPYMVLLDREDLQAANYFRDLQLKIEEPIVFDNLVHEIDLRFGTIATSR